MSDDASSTLPADNAMSSNTFHEDTSLDYDQTPVFSAEYLRKIQESHYSRLASMQKEAAKQNDHIIGLSNKLKECDARAIRYDQEISELHDTMQRLIEERNSVQQQLKVTRSSLLFREKMLDQKKSLLEQKEAIITTTKNQLTQLEKESSELVAQMREDLLDANRRVEAADELLLTSNTEIEKYKDEVRLLKATISELNNKLDFSSSATNAFQLKLESLRKENEALASSEESLSQALQEKELSLAVLMKETEGLQEEMVSLEAEYKSKDLIIYAKDSDIAELESSKKQLAESISRIEKALASAEERISTLSEKNDKLEMEVSRLTEELKKAEYQSEEKDRIISGDTKKLSELVEQVNKQKQKLSSYKANSSKTSFSGRNSNAELLDQIADLQRQVSSAQQRTDERIQEIAEELYHQYSKKHENKVSQLKLKYDAKLEEKNELIHDLKRQVQTMESQLNTEIREKQYLFGVLERAKVED